MGVPISREFRTSDTGDAETFLRARYGTLELTGDVRFGERVRADGGFALVDHYYGGRFTIGGELEIVSVGLPSRADGYAWEVDGHRGVGTGQPVLFQPGQPIVTHVHDVLMRAATFDPALLRREAAALLGLDDVAVRFASPRPRTPALGRLWARTVELAAEQDLADELLLAAVRGQLTRLLLQLFPLADEPLERRASTLGRWYGYRRAVEFIDDHASLPITLADIALAAGLSRRELDAAFHRHSRNGGSALDHLARARLTAARHDLVAADPARASVREVARRWGFSTSARFVQLYREAYGEHPASTLRRSRDVSSLP